ncbi:hypothetical protein FA95DRAFT_1608253 [Auriscalpium vulgare]|uniref:Uncharacterized protein n=1 Tax=Auriscalpium vulgare TaxID=40419 RepID=A0ACB8RLK5_9AGAM|nr:hypothetical protein FA95DRAFT_1608253 [Auriscalpium vulgare]
MAPTAPSSSSPASDAAADSPLAGEGAASLTRQTAEGLGLAMICIAVVVGFIFWASRSNRRSSIPRVQVVPIAHLSDKPTMSTMSGKIFEMPPVVARNSSKLPESPSSQRQPGFNWTFIAFWRGSNPPPASQPTPSIPLLLPPSDLSLPQSIRPCIPRDSALRTPANPSTETSSIDSRTLVSDSIYSEAPPHTGRW